jgi:hypothetical protein
LGETQLFQPGTYEVCLASSLDDGLGQGDLILARSLQPHNVAKFPQPPPPPPSSWASDHPARQDPGATVVASASGKTGHAWAARQVHRGMLPTAPCHLWARVTPITRTAPKPFLESVQPPKFGVHFLSGEL